MGNGAPAFKTVVARAKRAVSDLVAVARPATEARHRRMDADIKAPARRVVATRAEVGAVVRDLTR